MKEEGKQTSAGAESVGGRAQLTTPKLWRSCQLEPGPCYPQGHSPRQPSGGVAPREPQGAHIAPSVPAKSHPCLLSFSHPLWSSVPQADSLGPSALPWGSPRAPPHTCTYPRVLACREPAFCLSILHGPLPCFSNFELFSKMMLLL